MILYPKISIFSNIYNQFQMSERGSLQFRNKSISELVQELNSLGDDHVAMHPTTLIAVQQADYPYVRRFRSKSISRYTSGQQTLQNSRQSNQGKKSQFFLTDNSQKKYYYNQIIHELETVNVASVLSKFEQGFNTTIVMEFKDFRFKEIIEKISPWFERDGSSRSGCLAYFVEFGNKEGVDLLAGKNGRVISLEEAAHQNHPYYETRMNELLKMKQLKESGIKILKLIKKDMKNQLRILMFPQKFLSEKSDDPTQKIIKTQLNQILNYIKTNPSKRYENLNALLPKRFPTVAAIAELLLTDSANYVINWVLDTKENRNVINGRFDFFDKLSSIVNFIRRVPKQLNSKRIVSKNLGKNTSKSPNKAPSMHLNTMETDFRRSQCKNIAVSMVNNKDKTQQITKTTGVPKSMNQLEFCRSFQRKTHKYSISQFESMQDQITENNQFLNNDVDLFPECHKQITSQANIINIRPQCTETEAILILKAQHARQVSQYHETIQNLNKKILILTSQKGLEQLYTIHQRQIMHLQLKIEQLRKDISKLCGPSDKNEKNRDMKSMIKKLNDEISVLQKSAPAHKISKGKIKMLEKEVEDWRKQYTKSQAARTQLADEIKALTNRLNLQQKLAYEEKMAKQNQIREMEYDELSPKDQETYQELYNLITDRMEDKESEKYVMRKCRNILEDLSSIRETVLDCNNFLVDLQQHLQTKLGSKDPEVVLDCNRFIRSYLLDNLDIF